MKSLYLINWFLLFCCIAAFSFTVVKHHKDIIEQLNQLQKDVKNQNSSVYNVTNYVIASEDTLYLSPIGDYLFNEYSKQTNNPLLKDRWFLSVLDYYVFYYAKKKNLDPALIYAIIKVESNFNVFEVSSKDCIGLMQINFPVWKKYYALTNKNELFNVRRNISIGVDILSRYINKKGFKEGIKAYFGKSVYADIYYTKVTEYFKKYKSIIMEDIK